MAKRIKKRRHPFVLGIDKETGKIRSVLLPYSDATHDVPGGRVSYQDAKEGQPGSCGSCAASVAFRKHGKDDGLGFAPRLVETDPNHVWVPDKWDRNGMPTHLVKWMHHKYEWTDKYDVPGGKAKMLKEWPCDEDGTPQYVPFPLYTPRKRKSQAGSGRKKGNNNGSRSHDRLPEPWKRGAAHRAKKAGLSFE